MRGRRCRGVHVPHRAGRGVSATASIDPRALRQTLGQFATGVTVVTCRAADGEPVGMTANSFASVSLDPPLVLWSVDRSARSYDAFAAAERFAFSILAQDQADHSNRFSKPGTEKFTGVAIVEGMGKVPLIADAAAHLECVQHATFDGGDHLVIVGRVERFVRHDRRGLVFSQGRYGVVAPHPGTVGAPPREASERHPYDDFLVPLLYRAYNHLFRAFSDTLAAEEATGPQMRILAILAASGPTDDETLLTRTMLSQTSFADARASLLAMGLIADRDAIAAITEAGRTRLGDLLNQAAAQEGRSTGALDATEVELLRDLLRKLVRHHESAP